MADNRLVTQKPSEERSKTLVPLIKAGLAHMSRTFGREVDSTVFHVWMIALGELNPVQIAEGFRHLEQTFVPTAACPFPVPAHLLQPIQAAKENALAIEAEESWDKALKWVQRYYKPDCRDMHRPQLPRKIDTSMGAAGGACYISDCSLEELQWAKKRFIETYLNLEKLEEDENFLPDSEAKEILGRLKSEFGQRAAMAEERTGPAAARREELRRK